MPEGRCFILGAGFSQCCGLPLARELTPVVWRTWARHNPLDESAKPEVVRPGDPNDERIQEEFKAVRSLFPDCECDPDRDETWPDFEELITALDEAARFQESFERIIESQDPPWAQTAKRHLLRALEQRLSELTKAIRSDGLQVVKDFIGCLDLENDCVVSFNWDVLLEVAAEDLGITVLYRDDQDGGLRVAKPHGSVNLVDSARDEYENASTAINVHSLDEEYKYEDPEPRVVLRAHDARQAWVRQAWAGARLLVEPNTRKMYESRWLELQWVRALDMVRAADQLIVIGFSLPKADLRPRLLFQFSALGRPPGPRTLVVAPNADQLRGHYRSLTGLEVQSFSGVLEEWVRS